MAKLRPTGFLVTGLLLILILVWFVRLYNTGGQSDATLLVSPTVNPALPSAATVTVAAGTPGLTRSAVAASSPSSTPPRTSQTPPPAAALPASAELTCLVTPFASYYPALQMAQSGLDRSNGFRLKIVPWELQKPDGTVLNNYTNAEAYEMVRDGKLDCVFTTLDVFVRYGDFGAITAVVDESVGADQIWVKNGIATFDDFVGKTIAYEKGSPSEFLMYAVLKWGEVRPDEVKRAPQESSQAPIDEFVSGNADIVVGFEPSINEAKQAGSEFLTSAHVRYVVDVLVFSRAAIEGKGDAVQAFHKAWFRALRTQLDNPADAAKAIADWGDNDWSGVSKANSQQDLEGLLQKIAQATLGHNVFVMGNLQDTLVARLNNAQNLYRSAGEVVPGFDANKVMEPRFVLALKGDTSLRASQSPVNARFVLAGDPSAPDIPADKLRVVKKLPCTQVNFLPDSYILTADSQALLDKCVLSRLQGSTVYLRITGSSAWPGPPGRYSEEDIARFGRGRALAIAQYLAGRNIDPARLVVMPPQLPPPERRAMNDEALLAKDRFVMLELAVPTGGK